MNILGVSCHYHDAAAALVQDGRLVAAAAEERFTRRKHDFAFPAHAIDYCLAEAGITGKDIGYAGFYGKPLLKFDRVLTSCIAGWPRTWWPFVRGIPPWLHEKLWIGDALSKHLGAEPEIIYGGHHMSHAASAFLVSPFDEAAILTVDGVGEWATATCGVGRGNQITLGAELRFPHSVGLLFSTITAYLGFRVNDAEWKVMGLASYGEPSMLDKFRRIVDIKPDGSIHLDMRYFAFHRSTRRMFSRRWERLFGEPPRTHEGEITGFHRDFAASGQRIVEDILLRMAAHLHETSGLGDLCIAGGVGLNSVANWRILRESGFRRVFIQPAAGDDGGALGVAFLIHNMLLDQPREFTMQHACWGPSFSDEEIRRFLDENAIPYRELSGDELLAETARAIAHDQVVGWFQGRMEFGPRALGARSILANPRNPAMKDIINAKVKFREKFRPFAPSVVCEEASTYFELDCDSPFMLLVPPVRPEMRSVLPAVTHVDGTARVQTVARDVLPQYHALIGKVGELTGVPVVLNTSFNVRGEPIVCTPEDAWATFVKTGMDALAMGRFFIRKADLQV